jgi:DNA/RNA-binding domain of Phe-tRNA-synthetase-like protein
MFMAELEDQMLTAGHDLKTVQPPILIDVAAGSESYTRMNGKPQTLKPGDLYIRDAGGVLSSVIYGPDQRTRIQPDTKEVLFTTYAVPGIETDDLKAHLERLRDYVLLISEEGEVETLEIFGG